MSGSKILGILPSFYAFKRPNGRLLLEQRFLSGIKAHQEFWDGPILAVLEPGSDENLQRGHLAGLDVEVDPRDLGFEVVILDYASPALKAQLGRCRVALGALHHQQVHFARWAREIAVPLVYITEYTLRTRIQIIRANGESTLRQARRIAWMINQERLYRRGVKLATGIQCNGTPTFVKYKRLNRHTMLFYDCRISEDMLIREEALQQRLHAGLSRPTLRLVYAGRINRMKGADQLVEVGKMLKEAGVQFELDIYGDGPLTGELQERIHRYNIGDVVRLRGFLPFSELIPKLASYYDLFVCCHPQGDPALTYLEMMSQGVPIVGYANEAFQGILDGSNVGASVPIHDNRALCRVIQGLALNREPLVNWGRNGLAFARQHTLRETFRKRGEHLESVAGISRSP